MDLDKDAALPSAQETSMIELSADDLLLYREPLREALDTLCASLIFRNSPKSCEFIRHVVCRSLEGKADELKERLIGMMLLGRDASYDTSTDSGVRVRANDVRKRLTRYNELEGAGLEFSIALPTGTYVPRFFRAETALNAAPVPQVFALVTEESAILAEATVRESEVFSAPLMDQHQPPAHTLSFLQLAAPTLFAVFLCIVCMRWQLAQEQYFTDFWQEILGGDQALLYLEPSQSGSKQGLVAIQELNEAAPLLDLAGQFHRKFTVLSSSSAAQQGHTTIRVGLNSGANLDAHRYTVIDTAEGRAIVDRGDPAQPLYRHAALLTIVNGPQRTISIDGTDDTAIRTLVGLLSDESTFPGGLTDSLRARTLLQGIFPAERHAKAILTREPLNNSVAELDVQR